MRKGSEDFTLYLRTLRPLVLQFTVSVHQLFLLIIINESLTFPIV